MLWGYFGIIGSGKTLGAVIHAYREYRRNDRDIFSTMPLNEKYIDYTPLEDVDDFRRAKDGVILGDELWFLLDSRYSRKKVNNILASILLRSRKQMLDIIYTEQHYTQIDVRIRSNTQFFVKSQMEPYFKNLRDARAYRNSGGSFRLTQVYYSQDEGFVARREYSNVEKFFKLYDTTEDPFIAHPLEAKEDD